MDVMLPRSPRCKEIQVSTTRLTTRYVLRLATGTNDRGRAAYATVGGAVSVVTATAGLLVTLSVGGGVAGLVLAWLLYPQLGKPGVQWFLAALGVQAVWCLSYGLSLLVYTPELRWALEVLTFIAMTSLGPVFLGFALSYTGRGVLVRRRWFLLLLALPVVTAILAVTNPRHQLIWSDYRLAPLAGAATVRYSIEAWGALALAVGTICVGVAVVLLVDTVLSYGPLYRREATAVALSTGPPAGALMIWVFDIGAYPALNLAPAAFVLHAIFDGYAFVGQNMFETNPTTRRAAERGVTDDLETPVLVFDEVDHLVTFNDAARSLFGLTEQALGEGAEAAMGFSIESLRTDQPISPPASPQRQYLATVSPLTEPGGRVVGQTVILQDVTRARRREQRLTVLNRVLRHNLRNGMTIVDGFATQIQQNTSDETLADWAQTIQDSGGDLLAIAEKIHEFERVTDGGLQPAVIDMGELLTELAGSTRSAYAAATVTIDLEPPNGFEVQIDRALLRVVLRNLIENGIEHDPSPNPSVTIHASRREESLLIEVTDEGPGIPETELEPLRTGTESSLQHGSGIGLWIVAWGVQALGGTVDFETEGATSGSVVTITIPTAD
ncbi:MAG: histidine kinase N-terminal 7TM domain-containing protein [Halobacteriaceae archaeon]